MNEDQVGISPERARAILTNWFADRPGSAVFLREDLNPESDPDGYTVAYEANFEPDSLERAYASIYVTEDGAVGVVFETWARVAQRMGVRGGRNVLVGGHEPALVSEAGVLALLELIADGEVAIVASVWPVIGLTSVSAYATHEAIDNLVSVGYTEVEWLHPVPSFAGLDVSASGHARIIRLRTW